MGSGDVRARAELAWAAAVLMATACGDATSPADELTAARHRWKRGGVSYDLLVQRDGCECLSGATDKIVVSVREGVVSRHRFDDEQPVLEPFLQYPPVPGLFDFIATSISEGQTVMVKFDAATGAPLRIEVNPQDVALDGAYALTIELRSPVPLPPPPA